MQSGYSVVVEEPMTEIQTFNLLPEE